MDFDDFPDDASDKEIEAIVVQRFRALRAEVYGLMPLDCLLKPRNVLATTMVQMLDADMIKTGFVEKEDICAICIEKTCPHHNDVKDRLDRVTKIELLNHTKDLKLQ